MYIYKKTKQKIIQVQVAEDNLRAAFTKKKSVYQNSRKMLLKLASDHDANHNTTIEPSELVNIAQFLGIKGMTVALASAVMAHSGGNPDQMSLDHFESLFLKQPANDADNLPIKKGAYKQGDNPSHAGKIIYPQCKSLVQPPTDFNPNLVQASIFFCICMQITH